MGLAAGDDLGQGPTALRRSAALGALSAAPPVFDAALLQAVMGAVRRRLPSPAGAPERAALQAPTAGDGSLLPALPKMAWALWQDVQHRAAKMHGAFAARRQIPVGVPMTAGNASERAEGRRLLPPPFRVVSVASGKAGADGTPGVLVLVTNPRDLDAELVALASRWRCFAAG